MMIFFFVVARTRYVCQILCDTLCTEYLYMLQLQAMRQTCVYFELSTNQISPPTSFHSAIMSAPLCKLSGEDLVTWEALLTLKTLGETEEERVFHLLTHFGQACVVDQRFGAANAVVVRDKKNFLFFHHHRPEGDSPEPHKRHQSSFGKVWPCNLLQALPLPYCRKGEVLHEDDAKAPGLAPCGCNGAGREGRRGTEGQR